MFIDFISGSSKGTWYGLLECTGRHWADPNMANIIDMDCTIFFEDEVGIEFKGSVVASMRGCSYEASVIFTAIKLLYWKCNYPVGV